MGKWFTLCRKKLTSVIFTAPSQSLISSKVLASIPDFYLVRVIKGTPDELLNRIRFAKGYQTWSYPDSKKGGVRTKWRDKFNAILPNDYFSWYEEKRRGYLRTADEDLRQRVEELKAKKLKNQPIQKREEEETMEIVYKKVVGDPEKLKEVNEILKQVEESLAGQKNGSNSETS